MRMTGKTIAAALCFCFLLPLSLAAAGPPAGYARVNVKDRIFADIPHDWEISGAEDRALVTEFVEDITGLSVPMASLYTLSVSDTGSYQASAQMTFMPLKTPISPADFLWLVQEDPQGALKVMADVWRREALALRESLTKLGLEEQLRRPSTALELLDGQLAVVQKSWHPSPVNSAETVLRAQYHVFFGEEKAIITLSCVAGDRKAMEAIDRLKDSIVILNGE